MKNIILILILATLGFCDVEYGGTLVYGRSGDSLTLDPASAMDTESLNATNLLYDKLIKYKNHRALPSLASSWEVSRDGKTYTFYLRNDVYFAQTSYFRKKVKLSAKDVVFSFKRQFDGSNPYYNSSKPHVTWNNLNLSSTIANVYDTNETTVKFFLRKKDKNFLKYLSMDFASILSKDYATTLLRHKKLKDLSQKPVGTGRFYLEKWVKDENMVFNANKNYWGKKPYLDKLIFEVIPNSSIRATKLRANEIALMDSPDINELKNLEKNPDIKLLKKYIPNLSYIGFNTSKKPLNNLALRKAISYALDIKSITKGVYKKYGKPVFYLTPKAIKFYNKQFLGYNYDLNKSKKMLEEAGYANGFSVSLCSLPIARPYNPNGRKMSELIKKDLAKVGIKVKIINLSWQEYLLGKNKNLYDMALFGYEGENRYLHDFLTGLNSSYPNELFSTKNLSYWDNSEFSKILSSTKYEKNSYKKIKKYKEAITLFEENAIYKPIATSTTINAISKKVKGFEIGETSIKDFSKVWIDK